MKREIVYPVLAATLCVCLIASNIFETVIFNAGPITLTGGFLVFPIIYIINDCISEVFGYGKARLAILLAFCLNLAFVLSAQLVALLPESEMSSGLSDNLASPQQHFEYLFHLDLRITAASMAAFLVGSLLNSKVMVKMKEKDRGRRFAFRAILSTLAGETADSIIFFPIAFWGIGYKELAILMITQIVLKTLYEILALPLTKSIVRKMN